MVTGIGEVDFKNAVRIIVTLMDRLVVQNCYIVVSFITLMDSNVMCSIMLLPFITMEEDIVSINIGF